MTNTSDTNAQGYMALTEARNLRAGDRVTMLVSTMGADAEGVERIHPEGAGATIDCVDTLPAPQGFAVHVCVGEGDRAILNVFDEGDFGGIFPFARARAA